MMNRKITWISLIFVLLTFIFNLISFWFIDDKSKSFWISIFFGNFSILMYAFSSILMGRKSKYIYLNFQNGITISGYYIISTILNLCFILFDLQNHKVNLFVNLLLLAIFLIILFTFFAANSDTVAQLEYDKNERIAFYNLQEKAKRLLDKADSRQLNKKIESMYDKICSCQINRSINVNELDMTIEKELDILYQKLSLVETDENIIVQINKIMNLIDERNDRIISGLKRY